MASRSAAAPESPAPESPAPGSAAPESAAPGSAAPAQDAPGPDAPARGTRPRNRRAITLDAATELFYRRGYAQVGMTDIAKATNVGASALYRHFPSKADLLVAAIRAGISPYAQVLSSAGSLEGTAEERLRSVLRSLADTTIDHRLLGVLWQRDARNLSDDEQHVLRDELGAATADLASFVRAARPELSAEQADTLAWCTMGAFVSIGFHSLELPRTEFVELLFDIVTRVTSTPMPTEAVDATGFDKDEAAPESRRDNLITVATELFADRGFGATGIDEIGEAAGIAGPSVYSHFESKQAILAAAIERANAMLQEDSAAALRSDRTAPEKLDQLIHSYVGRANHDRFVLRTLISEMDQLSPEARERARQEQRTYIDAWVDQFRQFTPADPISARITVQAVLLVVNDAVQTPHLRSQPGFEQTLARAGGIDSRDNSAIGRRDCFSAKRRSRISESSFGSCWAGRANDRHAIHSLSETPYPTADLLFIDDLLTPVESERLHFLHDLFQEKVRPIATDYWNRAAFPFELLPILAEQNLVGLGLSADRTCSPASCRWNSPAPTPRSARSSACTTSCSPPRSSRWAPMRSAKSCCPTCSPSRRSAASR